MHCSPKARGQRDRRQSLPNDSRSSLHHELLCRLETRDKPDLHGTSKTSQEMEQSKNVVRAVLSDILEERAALIRAKQAPIDQIKIMQLILLMVQCSRSIFQVSYEPFTLAYKLFTLFTDNIFLLNVGTEAIAQVLSEKGEDGHSVLINIPSASGREIKSLLVITSIEDLNNTQLHIPTKYINL